MPYKKYTTTREGKRVYAIKNLRTGRVTKFSTPENRETGIRMREMYSHFKPTKKKVIVKKHSRILRNKKVNVKQHKRRVNKYGTIKRGKVKFDLYGKQHKLLLARKLPHSIVTVKDGKKRIKRVTYKRRELPHGSMDRWMDEVSEQEGIPKEKLFMETLTPEERDEWEGQPFFEPEDKIRKGMTREGRYLFDRGDDGW